MRPSFNTMSAEYVSLCSHFVFVEVKLSVSCCANALVLSGGLKCPL